MYVLWMRPRHLTGSTIGHSLRKLIDRGMPDVFVRLLVYWYKTQNACVRWSTACSEMFTVSNGVRQGGILSPLFFNVYMDGLSDILCKTECGCTMGGRMINHLMYAGDVVILSPSAKGLQRLINICAAYGDSNDIKFNHAKTVRMYLPSKGNCTFNSPLILALKVILLDRLQGIICSGIQEPYLLGVML